MITVRTLTFALAACLAIASTEIARADEPDFLEHNTGADFKNCREAHPATFPQLHCFNVEIDRQEKLTSDRIASLLSALKDPEKKKHLIDSQKQWDDYRYLWCGLLYTRGSFSQLRAADCYLRHDIARRLEVEELWQRYNQ